jgi:hypothetical protein
MKKLSFLLLAVGSIAIATSSCKKKQELSTTCYCSYFYGGGYEANVSFPMRGYYQERACAKKQTELQAQYGIKTTKCSLY